MDNFSRDFNKLLAPDTWAQTQNSLVARSNGRKFQYRRLSENLLYIHPRPNVGFEERSNGFDTALLGGSLKLQLAPFGRRRDFRGHDIGRPGNRREM
jgi:hypothetical protein